MKELSIKEKAKAYDEALERAGKELQACGSTDCDAARQIFRFFPELIESEDERIRKRLIFDFKVIGKTEWGGLEVKDILAWLEKQSNPTDINPSEFDLRLNKLLKQFETLPKEELASSLSFYLNVVQNDGTYREEKQGEVPVTINIDKMVKDYANNEECDNEGFGKPVNCMIRAYRQGLTDAIVILNLRKQGEQNLIMAKSPQLGEQKPADKIKPKFKVGDWVVENGVNRNPVQITSFEEDKGVGIKVWFSNGTGTWVDYLKGYHKWTIEDARDGDVLYSPCLSLLWIFKSIDTVYCGCNLNYNDGAFCREGYIERPTDAIPAIKEQRDLLFTKMKEAGYEWDAEKKELRKISQRMISAEAKEAMYGKSTAWSEEDEKMRKKALLVISDDCGVSDYEEISDWLKSLKQRIGG